MSDFAPPPARYTWTVGALLVAGADALAARFGSVTVRGELSGFSRAASGHCYFSLKDADGAAALLRCAMFRRAAALLDFAPADGQQLELRGRLGIFEPRGELQMVVESLQRVGTGTLYEEFLRRRDRLQRLGLFDAERKRPLPAYPQALGIITSTGAAALHDVLTTLKRRAPHVQIVIYPSLVQGADAPAMLIQALQQAAQRHEVDALLLVRGGGALEDLWAFNDEHLVRAVADCPLPVICGVGHETDLTLCELAADLRAATPTTAAELAAPQRSDLNAALQAQAARLKAQIDRGMQNRAQRLDSLVWRMGRPARLLAAQMQRLDERSGRLLRAAGLRVQHQKDGLQLLGTRLAKAASADVMARRWRLNAVEQALLGQDPQRILHRGYAWVEGSDGRAVTSVSGLQPSTRLTAVWSDGRAQVEVTSVESLPPSA